MKNLFILASLLITAPAFANEEAISCIANDGSSFIADLYPVPPKDDAKEPGYQYQIVGLTMFRPSTGTKRYEKKDLERRVETIYTEMNGGEVDELPYTKFGLVTADTFPGALVRMHRPQGQKDAPWTGSWLIYSESENLDLKVTCRYSGDMNQK